MVDEMKEMIDLVEWIGPRFTPDQVPKSEWA